MKKLINLMKKLEEKRVLIKNQKHQTLKKNEITS